MIRSGLILLASYYTLARIGMGAEDQTKVIVDSIQNLEQQKDAKCHATATRLEQFIYGTPLTEKARYAKTSLQKEFALAAWRQLTETWQEGKGSKADALAKILKEMVPSNTKANGDVELPVFGAENISITKRDLDHYGSVAYNLRTILALRQDMLFSSDKPLTLIGETEINLLKQHLDIVTLATLKTTDTKARGQNSAEIDEKLFTESWRSIVGNIGKPTPKATKKKPADFDIILKTIAGKLEAYKKYNAVSMPLFIRNLQVYFARYKWPTDKKESKNLQFNITKSLEYYALDSYLLAEKIAQDNGHILIRESDVSDMLKAFVPYTLNDYEDITFFPNIPEDSITIESYDADSFRDGGLHWQYLKYAIDDHKSKLKLVADPFAMELLAEGVAQYGVLILRIAGIEAKKANAPYLTVEHFNKGLRDLQARIVRHGKAKPMDPNKRQNLVSAQGQKPPSKGDFFSDVTNDKGIDFVHRSSDWLNRLLRSITMKSAETGTLSIPPAFGGGGLGIGDLNDDGIDDLLFIGGGGNKVYIADKKGNFTQSPLSQEFNIKLDDGHPGETRQPLIVDFDNDGVNDVFISYGGQAHRIYKGLGKGQYKEMTANAGLGGEEGVGGPALAFDYDRDGKLDLYIGYFGDFRKGHLPSLRRDNINGGANKLFRNTGNFKFEDVTIKAGVGDTGWTQALGHTDINDDGWQDIVVGNDFGINVYYINQKDGTFKDMAKAMGTRKPSSAMNVGFADLNQDSHPDIYISNIVVLVKDEKYVLPTKDTPMKFNPDALGNMRVVDANDFFLSQGLKNNVAKYTRSQAIGRGTTSTGWAWGAEFFDFDHDGDDDLYCVNGMNEFAVYSNQPYYTNVFDKSMEVQVETPHGERNVFFVNDGGQLLPTEGSGLDLLGNSRSIGYLDYDSDGDLDVILNNYHGRANIFRNNLAKDSGHWIKIKLQGNPKKASNRDAIGSRVRALVNGKQVQWREVYGGSGYMSQQPKTLHMGLGKINKVDIQVRWPNGIVSLHKGLKAGKIHQINQN